MQFKGPQPSTGISRQMRALTVPTRPHRLWILRYGRGKELSTTSISYIQGVQVNHIPALRSSVLHQAQTSELLFSWDLDGCILQEQDLTACWPQEVFSKSLKTASQRDHIYPQLEGQNQRWKKGEEMMLPRRMETERQHCSLPHTDLPALPSQKGGSLSFFMGVTACTIRRLTASYSEIKCSFAYFHLKTKIFIPNSALCSGLTHSPDTSCYKYLLTHPPSSLLNSSHCDSPRGFPQIPSSQKQWIWASFFNEGAPTPRNSIIFWKTHRKDWICIRKAHWYQVRKEQLSIANFCKTVTLPDSLPYSLISLLVSLHVICC